MAFHRTLTHNLRARFPNSLRKQKLVGSKSTSIHIHIPLTCLTEIRNKFEELEWQQRLRLSEGMRDQNSQWALETDPVIKSRNRYINVQAFASSRIHLKVPEGQCDFINASPITLDDSLTGNEARYIATQGPKADQAAHFWHMVFHETGPVAVVIMLTQTTEAGREKCAQYFPISPDSPSLELAEGDPFTDGDDLPGTVTLVSTNVDGSSRFEIRELSLKVGDSTKQVFHFLFPGWADYSKPEGEDRKALLELIKITANKAGSLSNPRIVHCSAGVGRTGTFIALDYLLRELETGALLQRASSSRRDDHTDISGEGDLVFETVNLLRQQRMMMVYNEMQLQFIYEVLREEVGKKLGPSAAQQNASTTDITSNAIAAEAETEEDSISSGERSPKVPRIAPAAAIIAGEAPAANPDIGVPMSIYEGTKAATNPPIDDHDTVSDDDDDEDDDDEDDDDDANDDFEPSKGEEFVPVEESSK